MILRITLGLAILSTPAVVSAQEADGPVKKKIDEFKANVVSKLPADRLKGLRGRRLPGQGDRHGREGVEGGRQGA